MTDHERRLVLRGMSIARGLLANTQCSHHGLIKAYQRMLAEAWNIGEVWSCPPGGIQAAG